MQCLIFIFTVIISNFKCLSFCFVVSLQDINMRKAFKGSTVQDQQVLSKGSTPNSVAEMHNSSDRPPPLSTLTAYRYCMCYKNYNINRFSVVSVHVQNSFLNTERTPLMRWNSTQTRRTFLTCGKRKCFRTRRKRGKKGGGKEWEHTLITALCLCILWQVGFHLLSCPSIHFSQEQKRCVENSTFPREVKKVRKARNRRQEWNMMAFDKELRPDHRHPQSLRREASSEGSLSPDGRLVLIFWHEVEMQKENLCICLCPQWKSSSIGIIL